MEERSVRKESGVAKKLKYTLFLGCTIPARSRNYEMSARKVAEALRIEFVDEPGFVCCGFPVKSVSHESALLMAAMNLAIAERRGQDLCALCSACTGSLAEANRELTEHKELRKEVNEKLSQVGGNLKYEGTIEVKHFAQILYEDLGVDKIRETVKKDISSLKIASHYGCHYLKPSQIYGIDDPEAPRSLDELIEATGAQSIDYEDKKHCCGGAVLAVDQDIALSVGRVKLENAKEAGADAMVVVCPFCSVMYDDNQRSIERKFETNYGLPVLYYPQLLGLALGFDMKELGLNMNKVKTKELVGNLG